ncbi:MAG: NAD(P)-dependent alcohol dehydrogenase [Spirochaetaceae bacterium]|jgi:D-xylulose reductase|nr:NAD(P)-dependent alcohol dehydrogenase [Spirochaetaceae bacterium]
MKALVLEQVKCLTLRDVSLNETVGLQDVRIQVQACGICGSDIHYYLEGAIGDFVLREPMILGHEAAGVVVEKGAAVRNVSIGDLVCMEPGIPRNFSPEVLAGRYNLDPDVVFWATPPVHGCLRETVVHPAAFCFKVPTGLSAREGAMMEPLAIGIEAAKQAAITPGDTALVIGAGTIGIMSVLGVLAGGCSRVFVSDVKAEKLNIAASYDQVTAINTGTENLTDRILAETAGRGVDLIIEASGSPRVYPELFQCARRGGKVVLVGMMNGTVPLDVTLLQARGIRIAPVFRYANAFDRALALVSAGKIDLKRLISKVFPFDEAIAAYEYAASGHPDVVKVMIDVA